MGNSLDCCNQDGRACVQESWEDGSACGKETFDNSLSTLSPELRTEVSLGDVSTFSGGSVSGISKEISGGLQQRGSFLEPFVGPPPLGPVGAGGWHFEADLTDDMREVARQAEDMYRKIESKELTQFNREYLTSVTLRYYVDPVAPKYLVSALQGRARHESVFTCREPIFLGSSFRIIGWDGAGASVIASEPSMFKKSMPHVLNHTEYIGWSAMDLNKPGADGVSVVMDFGGGFNVMHFLNLSSLVEIASLVEGQWRRRLKVVLLVDIPRAFQGVLGMFLGLLKEKTRNKIKCVSAEGGIKELVDMGCDEETLSYTKKYMTTRRRRSEKQTYHPIVDHSWFRERLAGLKLSQDTDYFTEEMHLELRRAMQEFRIHKWGTPETNGS